jgi:2-C-methyl-D-erythritol 4-phosphate cytidylyltransferase
MNNYSVVIPAAGSGKRMGLGFNKVFKELDHKPILVRTIEAFLSDFKCDEIVIVIREEEFVEVEQVLYEYKLKDKVLIALGGKERKDSVYNGLKTTTNELVLIHDAARPFVTHQMIDELLFEVIKYEAAIVAIPVVDTIKKVVDGEIVGTPNRKMLYQAQTPQAFKRDLIMKCYELAHRDNYMATDDASLIEHYSDVNVRVVEGSRLNMKLTTPEDLLLAETILSQMNEGGFHV